MTAPVDDFLPGLDRVLVREYPDLVPFGPLAPMDVPLVSSRIYTADSARGRVCVKAPGYVRRLDQSGEDHRAEWTLLLELQIRLHARGAPVEEVLRTRSGSVCAEHAGRLFRVVLCYDSRPFTGDDTDLVGSGRALGSFHAAGRTILDDDAALADVVRSKLVRDMPLQDSLAAAPSVEAALAAGAFLREHESCHGLESEFDTILADFDRRIWPLCDWAATRLRQPPASPEGLGHHDFHPANALFHPSAPPRILDLEQVSAGPLMKCVALGVTRFALEARRLGSGRAEREAADRFLHGYSQAFPVDRAALDALPDWIRLVELEKILRILRRAVSGNVYPAMVRKIRTHHLPLCERADAFAPRG